VLLLVLGGCPAVDLPDGGDAPPEIYLLEPLAGAEVDAGVPLVVRGVLADDETAPETLRVALYADGVAVGEATPTEDGVLDTTVSLPEGTAELSLVVTDFGGRSTTEGVALSVVPASRPSQPAVRVDPAEPVTAEALVASVVVPSVDPEGDPLVETWGWTVDGTPVELDGPEVPAGRVRAGELWTVTYTVSDGADQNAAARAVWIGDAPPRADAPTVSPSGATTLDVLSCDGPLPYDADREIHRVSWRWTVEGRTVDTAEPTLAAGEARRGDAVDCAVLADGVEVARSEVVRIENAAPSGEGVAITPERPGAGDVPSCLAWGGTDPDGDVVRFELTWLVDGAEVGPEAPALVRGQRLGCRATPTDGDRSGAPLSATEVRVANTPPGAPEVAFSREELVPGAKAACEVVTEPEDIDGDAVELVWTWEVDGAPVPGGDASYSTEGLAAGARVRCTATPSDGRSIGTPGWAELSLASPASGVLGPSAAWALLTGTAAGGQFGKALDEVGDRDGDGRPELLVTAPGGDGGTAGAAFLFYASTLARGGSLTDADADEAWFGSRSGDPLGAARGGAGIGDLDGDGRGEVALASPGADLGGADAGAVWILYGDDAGEAWGVDVSTAAAARVDGAAGDRLGTRIAGGDLDGDGVDDLALGAPLSARGGERSGVVAVWLGGRWAGERGYDDADAILVGLPGDELGWALAVGPDADADGYVDLAAGLMGDDSGGTDAGAAVVVSGDALGGEEAWTTAAWLVVRGTSEGARAGYDVSLPGDLDGDGLGEVVVGAYQSDGVAADAGAAHLYYGVPGRNREMATTEADVSFQGLGAQDQLGASIDGAGDLDGDGDVELLIGAARAEVEGAETGVVTLWRGGGAWGASVTAASADAWYVGDVAGGRCGDELAGRLDVEGDGHADLAVGCQSAGGGVVGVYRGP